MAEGHRKSRRWEANFATEVDEAPSAEPSLRMGFSLLRQDVVADASKMLAYHNALVSTGRTGLFCQAL